MPHTDFLGNRPRRTWPYGTRYAVRVIDVQASSSVLIVVDEASREGYVLLGGWPAGVRAGETGFITFRAGGPTGGFWEFTRD